MADEGQYNYVLQLLCVHVFNPICDKPRNYNVSSQHAQFFHAFNKLSGNHNTLYQDCENFLTSVLDHESNNPNNTNTSTNHNNTSNNNHSNSHKNRSKSIPRSKSRPRNEARDSHDENESQASASGSPRMASPRMESPRVRSPRRDGRDGALGDEDNSLFDFRSPSNQNNNNNNNNNNNHIDKDQIYSDLCGIFMKHIKCLEYDIKIIESIYRNLTELIRITNVSKLQKHINDLNGELNDRTDHTDGYNNLKHSNTNSFDSNDPSHLIENSSTSAGSKNLFSRSRSLIQRCVNTV